MVNQVYFSSHIDDLYRNYDMHQPNSSNQSICVRSPFIELLHQYHQALAQMLINWHNQQNQYYVNRKSQFSWLGTINQSLYDLQRHIQTLSHNQREFFDYVKANNNNQVYDADTQSFNQTLPEMIEKTDESEAAHMTKMHNQFEAISTVDFSPFTQFNLGDRIIIINANGNSASGVYIEATDNSIIWVDDLTNRLTMIDTKGLTIYKEF
ncbi:hypothetical protein [Bacillus sp. S/N-304-OC-R1]|uniref:hypothetical protein n=1 Tax=Bacillus sp. S/N-304-OC-R1 TaxID=2758034 RepID=UPI001C8DC239|nr:hypothetical protein [Bacillus sp. S/N-304-OC-R1]MBY0121510.1 hypothetical protein [Bacillus sp. S/N-304-OC-R1]